MEMIKTINYAYLAKLYSKEECDKYANTVWNKDVKYLEEDYLNFSLGSSNLESSFVFNTLTRDCFLSSLSSDQIGMFNFNANAKKSTSSGSGDTSFASESRLEYSFSLENFTTVLSSLLTNTNCDSDKEKDLTILSLCSLISSNENFGACKFNLVDNDSSLAFDFSLKKENSLVVSTTKRIYTNPVCSSSSNLPFLKSLLSLTIFSSDSCFAPFITSSMNKESNLCFSSEAINSFTSVSNLLASSSSNLGISTFNSAISTSPKQNHENDYLNVAESDWAKIKSINILEPQHVYDLSIEGTTGLKVTSDNNVIVHLE